MTAARMTTVSGARAAQAAAAKAQKAGLPAGETTRRGKGCYASTSWTGYLPVSAAELARLNEQVKTASARLAQAEAAVAANPIAATAHEHGAVCTRQAVAWPLIPREIMPTDWEPTCLVASGREWVANPVASEMTAARHLAWRGSETWARETAQKVCGGEVWTYHKHGFRHARIADWASVHLGLEGEAQRDAMAAAAMLLRALNEAAAELSAAKHALGRVVEL